jgi:HlyD family secretion protein
VTRPSTILPALLVFLSACGGGPGPIRGSVELPEVAVSPLATARVVRVLREEGDRVRAGDTLAILTQADADETLADLRARVASASASVHDLRAGARPQEIGQAEAELSAASAEASRAALELRRARSLIATGATSQQEVDDAETAARVADERRAAAEESLRLLRAGARPQQVRAAEAELGRARASLAAAEARLADLVLRAPVDGVVLVRAGEPGEVLGAGAPALVLGDVARSYVRAFVPQGLLERMKPGTAVRVLPDGWTGDAVPGRVTSVSPEAEFTPRVALTEAERSDQLFGVRITLDDPGAIPGGVWVSVEVGGEQ